MHVLQEVYLRICGPGQATTRLTEDKRTFEWSADTETAFKTLKVALCTAPGLGYPHPGRGSSSTPTPATWELGLWCPKYKMVIAYFSTTLSKAERN